MNSCPVTADLNHHLSQQDRDDAYAEAVKAKLDEMMKASSDVAEALDDIMGDGDVGSDGCSLFAGDIASVLVSSEAAFEAEAIRYFYKMRDKVREKMRDRAASRVDYDIECLEADAAEAAYEYASTWSGY